jgi:hypothetical protein
MMVFVCVRVVRVCVCVCVWVHCPPSLAFHFLVRGVVVVSLAKCSQQLLHIVVDLLLIILQANKE